MFFFTRITLAIVSIPSVIALFVFSKFFLSIFGEVFISGTIALKILVIGKLVGVIAGPVGVLFTMTGNHYTSLKVFSIAAIMNIVLNFVFINLWGINGAALASTITLIFWNVTLISLSKKKFGSFI